MKYLEGLYKMSFPMVNNRLINKAFFVWNHLVQAFMRKTYPTYCNLVNNSTGVCSEKYDREIVVSITSFPARMETIKWTLESITRQSMKPNRIEVWLCEDEFPELKIPDVLNEFIDKGVEVFFTETNLRPHNKSFHAAHQDRESILITLDDDILYSEDVVKRLYESYLQSDRHTVICELAHEILLSSDAKVKMYDEWNWESKGIKGPSDLLMAKGVGGVLYPVGFFGDDYFDIETIKECCLMADDLWLKFNGIRHRYPVMKTRRYAKNIYCVKGSQKVSLQSINNGENRNNVYLHKLLEKYKDEIDWTELQ